MRDGARMLVLGAPAVATAVGAGVVALVAKVEPGGRWLVGGGLVLLPVLLLADAAWGAGGRLTAVSFPAGFPVMRQAVASGPAGDVLVLPLSSFRRPDWNASRTTLDPVGRYQSRDYLSSDVLVVGSVTIAGEDPRVGEAQRALDRPGPTERAAALADLGIAMVVTDRTAPGLAPQVAGRVLTPADAELTVLAVAGDVVRRPVPAGWYAATAAAWSAFVATALVLPPLLLWRRRTWSRR